MLVKRFGMKQKNKKADFLVWGTLDASLLGNLLITKAQLKQVKTQLDEVKEQLEAGRISNST